jgi:hypothetical protein
MPTEKYYQDLLDRIEGLRQTAADQLGTRLSDNPRYADVLNKQIDDMLAAALKSAAQEPQPRDHGLAELIGIGPDAATEFGSARIPAGVRPYDETVTSERIVAMADLYYIYQHEKIGIFRVVQKLKDLFEAGAVRLSSGEGAYALYQFDRRQVLRFTKRDRLGAYCRAFGYCAAPAPPGARPNKEFHPLFTLFINEVTSYWRDKRISDVIRERAFDPSFGSISTVRRSGLDLRNNLKFTSYGHLNVLRVEVMQLLDEAFRILNAEDVRRLFGADTAWDVIEEVLTRYFNEDLSTSPRQRMAIAGRDIIRWLAQPHIQQTARGTFEALLADVAESAEEWLTSAQAIGVAERPPAAGRVVPWNRRAAVSGNDKKISA